MKTTMTDNIINKYFINFKSSLMKKNNNNESK